MFFKQGFYSIVGGSYERHTFLINNYQLSIAGKQSCSIQGLRCLGKRSAYVSQRTSERREPFTDVQRKHIAKLSVFLSASRRVLRTGRRIQCNIEAFAFEMSRQLQLTAVNINKLLFDKNFKKGIKFILNN